MPLLCTKGEWKPMQLIIKVNPWLIQHSAEILCTHDSLAGLHIGPFKACMPLIMPADRPIMSIYIEYIQFYCFGD